MSKGYITKLSFRPYTLEQACRVRYYIKIVCEELILRCTSDLSISSTRILLNYTPVYTTHLDFEQPTVHHELEEISAALTEPVTSIISGAVTILHGTAILNLTTHIYDHNQVVISYEVYER